jgi:hypothetical protein
LFIRSHWDAELKTRHHVLVVCLFLLITALFTVSDVFADVCAPDQPGIQVFFINGILNDLTDTISSALVLRRNALAFFDSTSTPGNCLKRVSYSWNPTQGILGDLFESYLQLAGGQASGSEFDALRLGAATVPVNQALVGPFAGLVLAKESQNEVINQVREKFVAQYNAELSAGNKVVVIGHSQGNFYANAVYAELYPPATPLSPSRKLRPGDRGGRWSATSFSR